MIRANDRNVETYGSAEEFLTRATLSHPGCLILDLRMPGLNGIQLQELLVKNNVQIPIIFLTANGDVPIAVGAMRAGAVDFLMKPVTEEEDFAAIDRAISQEMEYIKRTRERDEVQARVDLLTEREREVMVYVIAGFLNKQIGDRLDVGTTCFDECRHDPSVTRQREHRNAATSRRGTLQAHPHHLEASASK